ncbi:MAG: NAD(P)/FAD-dependent oxidoreductase [Nanoarchaeota archaeon]|nr:NAD(P)/FAD-dependent oxidoreductase [Nanoarchaeota archaeon]MBU1622014.1 NAD(P)/FAD-dependent oxidoreductase [Nanoarchaeota archaeon]MBU1974370.1 NAD(P)/FAD-dependent oxidoreductase [Nanoarchaeota archaeon]
MNIAIIGAGPIGCYAGYLLAKTGHQISIYEKKAQIGLPIQCTGLLTSDFDMFDLDSCLVNTFNGLEINTSQQKIKLTQKEYLVCREKFDLHLLELAQQAGVKVYFNHSFVGKDNGSLIIKHKDQEIRIQPNLVLAADGPLSPVAKAYHFYHPQRKNYLGIQATVEGNFNSQAYHTYFGKDICPGLFAWIVPESPTTARVGLAVRKNARAYFNQFIEKNNFEVEVIQAGIIPLYHPKQKLKQDNCYLLGDAAGFVKATTLGGLIPGMKQVEILVDCLNHNKDYHQELKPLKRKLWLHLQIRKVLNKFSDRDYNKLFFLINQPKIKRVMQQHTRDNPLPLLIKTLLKEPRFLYFMKYLF